MIIRNLLRSSRAVYSTRCVHASKYPSISPHKTSLQRSLGTPLSARRQYAVKSDADSVVEELQELYATAKDEFEIAQEETEKKTVYAADDRAAAQEELTKLKEAFSSAVKDAGDEETGKEITRRVGQRIRELERAVEAMEEMARED